MFGQPRAVYLIAALTLCESFSYYGMRSILVLYLTSALMFTDESAYTLYAVYISLVEIGGIFGGIIADKYLGARKSIALGALIISVGHLCMLTIPYAPQALFIALGLIVTGSALFRVNCATLLAEFYGKSDTRLQTGFTIFYTALNAGGFLSMFLCGVLAQSYGWHIGFAAAGLGMLIGFVCLAFGESVFEDKGLLKAQTPANYVKGLGAIMLFAPLGLLAIQHSTITMEVLPLVLVATLFIILGKWVAAYPEQKNNFIMILISTLLLSLFYAVVELIGSGLVLFAERSVDRSFFGYTIPSATLSSMNPITIIILGFFLTRIFGTSASFKSISYAFLIMSLAFALLLFSNLPTLLISFMLIALAELLFCPVVYTLCTKLAPEDMRGQSMGVVMLGFSLGGLMSGHLGKALMTSGEGNEVFNQGFTSIMIICLVTGILVMAGWLFRRRFRKPYNSSQPQQPRAPLA